MNNTTNTNRGDNAMELTINGVTVKMVFDNNGIPSFVDTNGNAINITMINPTVNINVGDTNNNSANDCDTENTIRESRFVPDRYGYRRWVMAQMFKAMNFNNGLGHGYDYYYKKVKPYYYQWKTVIDELKYLKDNANSDDTIRAKFFNKNVVDSMLDYHIDCIKNYLNTLGRCSWFNRTSVFYIDDNGNKKCKYIDVSFSSISNMINALKLNSDVVKSKTTISDYYSALVGFVNSSNRMLLLPDDTAKSKVWFDAFKGAGAYYTLENMIENHGCRIKEGNVRLNHQHSLDKIVDFMNNEYENGYGYKVFGILKKCIADNNFDFYSRMEEIYSNR